MAEQPQWWVGTDESGGIPNPGRPDVKPPPHWRLEMVAAAERPRGLELSPDGSTLALMVGRDTSDVWTLSVADGQLLRMTTGRLLAAFWEDGNAVWSPDGTRLAFSQNGHVPSKERRIAVGARWTLTPVRSSPTWRWRAAWVHSCGN